MRSPRHPLSLAVPLLALCLVACDQNAVTTDGGSGMEAGPETGVPDADPGDADSGYADVVDVDGSDGGPQLPPKCFTCPAGKKLCGDRCVPIDDPEYGCDPTACGASCYAAGVVAHASIKCAAGKCTKDACFTKYADCDNDPTNGCEAPLDATTSCGACGTTCSGGTPLCAPNGCVATCPFPTTQCGSSCADLSSSTLSCGTCGKACNPTYAQTSSCSNGTCTPTCSGGGAVCGGQCWPAMDPNHCGNACKTCPNHNGGGIIGCEQGQCALTVDCAAGWVRCGQYVCASLGSDAQNCGACGNACGGGKTCIRGVCTSPGAAEWITGLSEPGDILVDATNVYWTDTGDNTVWQADKVTLVKKQLGASEAKPYRLASDGTYVYWTSNLGNAIRRAPIGGGQPASVVYAATDPRGIAVSNGTVYWAEGWPSTNSTPPRILRGPTDGTGATVLVARSADSLAVSNGYLYGAGQWTQSFMTAEATFRLPVAGGAILNYDFAPSGEPQPMAFSLTTSFVYSNSTLTGGSGTQRIPARIDIGGGGRVMLSYATVPLFGPYARAIAADDCAAYTVDAYNGTAGVYRYYGGVRKALPLTTAVVDPRRIAIDDTFVYWTDKGFIGRIAK